MSPGSSTESYPAFARIGLRENPGKNLNQINCPDRDSNPGHLVSQPDVLTVTPQMVKCKRKTSNSWTENDMQKAIKAFRERRSQRHAAELLGVPHSCQQQRFQSGQDNHLKSKGRQTTFTPEQENELVSRILKLYAYALSRQHRTDSMVMDVAKGLTIGAEVKDMGKSFNRAETAPTVGTIPTSTRYSSHRSDIGYHFKGVYPFREG
ncbi:hypothetical protein ANN_15436 [Periplaneta americana]|uniref:HTH psq-type domain-containing protein n=1 Tax=Periplaneta americana TaxID=6978 RepID=A0ABQ8SGD7_PERAM|nr:hypothetical protein ANN_15436 [Periplaneta americana]